METSTNHQKQKLPLLKPRRFARSITRQFVLSTHPPLKARIGIIGAGIVVGVGVPALVYATQQEPTKQRVETTGTATVTIQSDASSQLEGALPIQTQQSPDASTSSDPNMKANVTINGQSVPLKNGSVQQVITDDTGTQVDVNVTIDHSSSSSSANSTTTEISVDSHSSSSSEQNTTRGSPRR